MTDRYILEGKMPVECPDHIKWGKWFQSNKGIVCQQDINGSKVSTVFLGLDHRFGDGPPLLFETMIFCGKHDQYQDRCSTWDEAEEMHKKAVELVTDDP